MNFLFWFSVFGSLSLEAYGAMDGLIGGARLILVPPWGTLVHAMEFKLALSLVPLLGGGMIAKGAMVITFTFSLTKVLLVTKSIEAGTPSKL